MIRAEEYGKALFALAEEEGLADVMRQELEVLSGIFTENPDYVTLLCTPAIASREKPGLLDEALASCHVYVRDAVKMLTSARAADRLPAVAAAFGKYLDESRGILRAKAISAVPMHEEQIQKLTAKLSAMTGKPVILSCECDPRVLGGVELICDGMRFDGSIRARLENLRRELIGAHI